MDGGGGGGEEAFTENLARSLHYGYAETGLRSTLATFRLRYLIRSTNQRSVHLFAIEALHTLPLDAKAVQSH